jgi:hypothetical protein
MSAAKTAKGDKPMNAPALTKVVGFGLQAALIGDEITISQIGSESEIVRVPAADHPRARAQFGNRTNYRAGQPADSKMGMIMECLIDVPELQEYL